MSSIDPAAAPASSSAPAHSSGATPRLPAAIFIIRHGEKPTTVGAADSGTGATDSPGSDIEFAVSKPQQILGVDIDGQNDDDSLIPQGWQRAGGLATLFDPTDGEFPSPYLSRPTLIAAPSYGKPEKHRTYQTVWPLALKFGATPTVTVAVGDEDQLVAWLLEQSDQTVLVCWEHDHIQDIMAQLAPVISGGDVPGPWPSDRFDIVVALTPDPANPGSYECHQVPQLLLAGDSSEPIPA